MSKAVKTKEQETIFKSESRKLSDIVKEVTGYPVTFSGTCIRFAEEVGINRGTVSKLKYSDVYHDKKTGDVFKVKVTKICNIKGGK